MDGQQYNPFYVEPKNKLLGLPGLAEQFNLLAEQKRKERAAQKAIEEFARVKQAASQVDWSDPGQVAKFMADYPIFSKAFGASFNDFMKQAGIKSKKEYTDSRYAILGDPDASPEAKKKARLELAPIDAQGLIDYDKALGKGITGKAPTLKIGKNARTGKNEYFYLDENKKPQWTGIEEAAPKAGDDKERKFKNAQSLVLKFTAEFNPLVAALLNDDFEKITDPNVKKSLLDSVPDELKADVKQALKIMDEYYGVPSETYTYDPIKGFIKQ